MMDWPSTRSSAWLSDFFDNDRFFDSDWLRKQTTVPAVNVMENETSYTIEMAAPGYKKNDFSISVENGVLVISNEWNETKEEKEDAFTRREFNYQSFSRSFTLPENVDEDKLDATYQEGLLKVVLMKKRMEQPKSKKTVVIK